MGLRKNFKKRINVDQRKYISTGYKGISKNKKEIPKKANHFVFHNPDTGEEYYPELREFYGDECKEIFVMFPSDTYTDFFSDDYNKWTSTHNLKRRCDGETCLHVIDEDVITDGKKVTYKAGTETECICKFHGWKDDAGRVIDKDNSCGCDLYLKAYILNPANSRIISPNCYLFYSGSENNADNIRSQLEQFKRFSGIPFRISLKEVKRNDRVYYLWNIIPHLTPEQLIQYQYSNVALTDGQNLLQLTESVHTETKTEYDENGSPELTPTLTHAVPTGEPILAEDPKNELEFSEKKQWTVKQFEDGYTTGEIEGEDNIRGIITNILESSPTEEDLQLRGKLLLEIVGLTETVTTIIMTAGKLVMHKKGWESKKENKK